MNMNKSKAFAVLNFLKGIAILTLLPVFFTFLFGFVFSKDYVENIPVAVLDLDQTPFSRSVIDNLEDSEGLRIAAYASSLAEMEELLLQGKVYGGLVLPENFYKDIQRSQSPSALFLVDFSNIIIGNNLVAYASGILNTLNAGLSVSIMEAGEIIPYVAEQSARAFTFVDRVLYDPRQAFFLYMYAILLSIFIQQTYLITVSPVFIEEKNRLRNIAGESGSAQDKKQDKKIKVTKLGGLVLTYFISSLIGALGSLTVAHNVFGFPLRGGFGMILCLLVLFLLNLTAIAILLGTLFGDTAHCVQFVIFLAIPTILLSGYIWPPFMMEPWFSSLIHKLWPMIYFTAPFQHVSLKGVGLESLNLSGGLLFALILWPAACLLYALRIKWLTRKPSTHGTH